MSTDNSDKTALVARIAEAIRHYGAMPEMPTGLSLEEAYRLQERVVRVVSPDGMAGIKCGLTAPAVQQHLGLSHAVIGRLYRGRERHSGCGLTTREGLLLECEVGVRLDAGGAVVSIEPVVEVVFLQFDNPQTVSAPHVVAANLGAEAYISGSPMDWHREFEATEICLYRDDALITSASVRDSLGGPTAGARWVVQEAARRNVPCESGTLLILGTCGTSVPALAGVYRADYGPLGSLEFRLV